MIPLKPVRGTQDILPEENRRYRLVEDIALGVADRYGFGEISTPIFEFTEVFSRTLGDSSDIVTKEIVQHNYKGFDEWDREVLKTTMPKIRNLFKSYYNARDFNWGEDAPDGVGYLLEQMRESIRPPAGAKYLPWWKKRKLRKRPLNKNGGMCSSSDED